MFKKQDPGTILNNFPSTIHIPYQVRSSHQHPPIIFSKNFLKKEKIFSGVSALLDTLCGIIWP